MKLSTFALGAASLWVGAGHALPVVPRVGLVHRMRGGAALHGLQRTAASGAGGVQGRPPNPSHAVAPLAGCLISAGVIGALNALGLGLTLLVPRQAEKVTDLLGTGAIPLAAVATHVSLGAGTAARPLLLTACVAAWGARLAGFLFYRILKTGSDSRLTKYFETTSGAIAFWSVSAAWGWVTLLPHSLLCAQPGRARALGPFGVVALAAWVLGFGMESLADWQKWSFKRVRRASVVINPRPNRV